MEKWRINAKRSNPGIKRILTATFPNYKGRKIVVDNYIPDKLDSYWSEGTRHNYVFYNLGNDQIHHVAGNHPEYESDKPRDTPNDLPANVLIVEHFRFCGKDMGIRIHVNLPIDEARTKLLPMFSQLDY